jgi:hypothetical protein
LLRFAHFLEAVKGLVSSYTASSTKDTNGLIDQPAALQAGSQLVDQSRGLVEYLRILDR